VTTEAEAAVQWPAWESAAFYMQDAEVMYPSIAAQRHGAPVYWYHPDGYPTGFWVLSKWEHQRFVGSHPELFSSRFGFAIGDASDPSTVIGQLPEWAQKSLEGDLGHAETRRMIAKGKLSMGDPDFEGLILSDPPRHGRIRNVLMKALRPSLVRSLKGRIAEITDEFLDEITPGEEVDFVTSLGRIPAALMTELIGVPRDMRDRFIEMASAQMLAITIDPNRSAEEVERIARLTEEFHTYWRDRHGPLVISTRSGSHVLRYEQHHRALSDYGPEDDGQYDGVTEQWFESMEEYRAHIAEKDFADVWADLPKFLDVDRLAFVVTEEPVVILAGR